MIGASCICIPSSSSYPMLVNSVFSLNPFFEKFVMVLVFLENDTLEFASPLCWVFLAHYFMFTYFIYSRGGGGERKGMFLSPCHTSSAALCFLCPSFPLVLVFLLYWDRTLLNSPGWFGVCNPPAPVSWVLELTHSHAISCLSFRHLHRHISF